MKNKCFKRIKDEKQRKHGKWSNKIDKTHDFDSYGNSICTPGPPSIPETLDPVSEGSDEEVEHLETQAQALRDYQLARDRVHKVPKDHPRFGSEGSDHPVTYRRRLDAFCTTQPLLGVLSFSVRHRSRWRSFLSATRKAV
ncbi:hypothetical protein M9H77_26344 [Catharanthus roseus]|uniref:Uncharacterized protein n=1 Tax=Catharanthus roseus TaxID=4058 RepID=A0ACC0A9W2_CATRO|nr:hypothetical protein M9H77_26344 [Catharanthus roseus]